ncbi:MAG TPA: hypothetical protein VFD07_01875 [Candidatus Krumholzibacteria bacterium]|nr:hypothetical protein [Candidatus Krumholzibacteria bacterium]
MSATDDVGCRATIHESPAYGRVLEIVLAASQSPNSWNNAREVIRREVDRGDPQGLVIDLRALDSLYGAPLLGVLVEGAEALRKRGVERRTRIVATVQIAGPLANAIRIARMDFLFDEKIYPDLESAVIGQDLRREEPTV